MRMGLGQRAATAIAYLLVLAFILSAGAYAYHRVWAGPQAEIADLQLKVSKAEAAAADAQRLLKDWKATARDCKRSISLLQAAEREEQDKAAARLQAAQASNGERRKALLDPAKVGPGAMSEFFTEIYQ